MDRIIVYPGAIPQDTDILNTNRNPMIGLGNLADAVIGVNGGTIVNGLALSATSPASLTVNVGPGSIYAREAVDSASYGSLGTDSALVVKQGVNLLTTQFTLTPPTASGTTQLYLIQASLLESDGGATVLNYYNSTPPNTPFSGPGGSGTSQNTLRTCVVSLQLVSTGVPYATGSDPSATAGAVPAVTSGWVGLYLIPVSNGQTSLTNTQLTGLRYPGAPWLPQQLSAARLKLTSSTSVPVSATGSDSWAQPSTFTPFATLQHAVNYLMNSLDFNGQPTTILLGPGNFSGGQVRGLALGQTSPIVISGQSSASTTITAVNANGLNLYAGAEVILENISIQASGTGTIQGVGVGSQGGSQLTIGNDVKFLNCTQAHMFADTGGLLYSSIGYTIAGNSYTSWACQNAGLMQFIGCTVTFTGTPAFTVFATADYGAIKCNGMTFVGSVTGARYLSIENGLISTGGAGASYLPGNAAGSTASGGQYT